jgi:hemoglobin
LCGVLVVGSILVGTSGSGILGQWASEELLYDRLGRRPAITAVVDEFVSRVAINKRINTYFAATASGPARLASFKGKLVAQICQATSGSCRYMGKSLEAAHSGMGITSADFNGWWAIWWVRSISSRSASTKNISCSALGPMKSDIVEKP